MFLAAHFRVPVYLCRKRNTDNLEKFDLVVLIVMLGVSKLLLYRNRLCYRRILNKMCLLGLQRCRQNTHKQRLVIFTAADDKEIDVKNTSKLNMT